MKEMIHELIEYRHLLYMLTLRDIKVRYKQSVMGFLWAILMPLCVVAAGIIVKAAFAFVSSKSLNLSDMASVSVKALPWSFFIGSLRFATNSLTGNFGLVTKIYFPREVFPMAAVIGSFVDFSVASVALFIVLVIAQIGISVHIIWLPALLIILVLFTMGAGMFFACANLFYRDVKYLVDVILTFAIFFTPVFYEASLFGKWAPLLLLNPIGSILEGINAVVVLQQPPDIFWLSYAGICSLSVFLGGWIIFHKAEFLFAERI